MSSASVDGVRDVVGHGQSAGKHLVGIDLERVSTVCDVVDWTSKNVERRRERQDGEREHHTETVDDVLDHDVLDHHREDVDVFRDATEQHERRDPAEEKDNGHRLVVETDTAAELFLKITDGLILFSADIRISPIYADVRKFG